MQSIGSERLYKTLQVYHKKHVFSQRRRAAGRVMYLTAEIDKLVLGLKKSTVKRNFGTHISTIDYRHGHKGVHKAAKRTVELGKLQKQSVEKTQG